MPLPPGRLSEREKIIAQNLPGGETLLLDYLNKLDKHRKGRRAVLIQLSRLLPVNRREHHLRIAASTFDTLVKQLKGQIFALSNADLMLVFKESALDEVEAAMVKLRFMFSEDPLLAGEGSAGKGGFIEWFALGEAYDAVVDLVRSRLVEERQRREQELQQAARPAARPPRRGQPLTPAMLAKMEAALASADLTNMVRRQPICAMVGRSAPQPVFYELFVSIADLRETLLPNVNLASSPWLFQELTETLDRRVLSMLNKHDDRTTDGDVSINLNVQTLLSNEFLTFDDNVKTSMRGTIVIELQKVDIFDDLGAFLFARDFVHERGYRICIDGVNFESLPFINRERLGVDLIKLVWDPAMADGTLPDGGSLNEYVRRGGPARVILSRCDGDEAIQAGQQAGISLFQGHHIDDRLAREAQKAGLYRRRR